MIFNYFFFHSLFNCEELHYTFLFKEFYFNPWTWEKIKNYYSIVVVISWILISISFYNKLSFTSQDDSKSINSTNTASDLSLTLGKNKDSLLPVIIPEKGLYQNVLITGTIGTGKTSSAIYPFIHQLLKHDMGMLILDVKGNLHIKVKEMAKKLNKKERRIALKSALTSRVQADKFVVIDEFKFDEIKTKNVKAMLDSVGAKKALVVMGSKNDNLVLSARNLPGVKTALTSTINVYDILKYDTVVVSKEAVANIEEVYA